MRNQFVEATLFDTAVGLLHPHAANWFVNGQVPALAGSGHPNVVPYDKFVTRSGEVFLGIGNDGQFRKFCEFCGVPELAADPRYASNGERNRNRVALRASIENLLADRDAAELCEALLKAGRAEEAYKLLEPKEFEGAGDQVYDFLLASAALVAVAGLSLAACGHKDRPRADLAASRVTTIGVNITMAVNSAIGMRIRLSTARVLHNNSNKPRTTCRPGRFEAMSARPVRGSTTATVNTA